MSEGNDPARSLRDLLARVAAGTLSPDAALQRLAGAPSGPVADFAVVDHGRAARTGFPEVVLCRGKEPEQAAAIAVEILTRAPRVLLTRASAAHAAAVQARLPRAVHHSRCGCIVVDEAPLPRQGLAAVVCAGTADLPVAEEARVTLETFGVAVAWHADVGVAGLHRLLERIPAIRQAQAIVAIAGMDGAMPSVLAGLVSVPVIAVPTSTGYGVSEHGLAPLLAMLGSCAAGVAVVNVDHGFGAGYLAAQIVRAATPRLRSEPSP